MSAWLRRNQKQGHLKVTLVCVSVLQVTRRAQTLFTSIVNAGMNAVCELRLLLYDKS